MPDTNINPPRESLYNYFKSLYAVILIRKVIEIHCLNIVETPNKQWGTYLHPLSLFPEQNCQSAHIWGWGGSEGDRAVRRPLRLHAGQCGKCAVYRNPLQGTAQPGAITHNALISCSVLCFCSFFILDVCVCVSDWSQTCGGRHVTGKGLLCGQSSDFSHTPRDGHMRQENGKRKSGPRKYLWDDRGWIIFSLNVLVLIIISVF